MKIKIEQKDFRFEFEALNQFSESLAHKAVSAFYKLINDTSEDTEHVFTKSNCSQTQTQSIQPERPAFRDRLPNNVVDITDLTIKQAVTESALVRCPECGQAHCIAVHDNGHIYFMARQYDKNEFCIIAEFNEEIQGEKDAFVAMCCKDDTDRKAYFSDIRKVEVLPDVDFGVQNTTELFCPVCCKSHPFSEWKNAFDEPLTFFETEHLCDACGGEMLPQMAKGYSYQKCEVCGHTCDYVGE